VNGQLKYTTISDNEGALIFTPGMAPSNSGNAAIDGSVTVVQETTPVVVETVASTPQHPRVVAPVRRVTPVSQPAPTTVPVTSVNIVPPVVVTIEETVVITTVTPPMPAAVEVSVINPPVMTISVSDSTVFAPAATASVTSSATRVVDPGASLSLAALGTNKGLSTTSTVATTVKASTTVLDEMYRQLGTMMSTSAVNGYNLVTVDDSTDDMADMWDSILDDGDN
jgi:hypothetical protein